MDKLRIYVPGHNSDLERVPDKPFLKKVFLPGLDLGKFQDNQLAESRVFLWNEILKPAEYIGFLSPRYHQKFPELLPFKKLDCLNFEEKTVFCVLRAYRGYASWFQGYFPGIGFLMEDMANFAGMSLLQEPTLLGNNFICSWSIFLEFHEKWKEVFFYLYEKYPPHKMTFYSWDDSRRAGYLYETLSAMIFAHLIQKYNLNLKLIKSDCKKNMKRILI